MPGVDSRLYEIITMGMQIIFLSLICFIIAVPIFTIPIALLLYCKVAGNIVSDKKLLDFSGLNKSRIGQMGIYFLLGICSIYSSLMLTQMQDFFISRLIISLIISFYATTAVLILEQKNTFFHHARNAFFYTIGYFYKTLLPVFLYLQTMRWLNGMMPVYAVIGLTILFCYLIFKLNYKALVQFS